MAYKKIEIKRPRGINLDLSPYAMPNEIWSDGSNVTFRQAKTNVALGYSEVYGTQYDSGNNPIANTTVVGHPMIAVPWTDFNSNYWFYANDTDIYRIGSDGSHTEVTRTSGDYTGDYDDGWTSTLFNGALLFNNGDDVPQFYNESTGKFEALTGWVANERCGVIRPFKNFLIALDLLDTSNSQAYPSKVLWSDTAPLGGVPTSWNTGDPAVQAGYNILPDTQGRIIEGRSLNDTFFIYKNDAVWAMQFIGGNLVFSFRKIFSDGSGILARDCVTEFEGKHFVVGIDDVYIHDGTSKKSVITNQMRKALYSQINPDHTDKVKCVHDSKNREIVIHYPSVDSATGESDKVVIYNYESDSWTQRDINRIAFIGNGHVQRTLGEPEGWDSDPYTWDSDGSFWGDESYNPSRNDLLYVKHGDANNTSGFFIGESGLSINGVTYKPFVERIGLDFEDDKGYKYINAIYPHFEGEGTVNIYVGTEESQGGGITWSQPQEFVIGEDYKATFRESGRYIGIKMESKTDNIWSLTGYSIEYSYEGRQ